MRVSLVWGAPWQRGAHGRGGRERCYESVQLPAAPAERGSL